MPLSDIMLIGKKQIRHVSRLWVLVHICQAIEVACKKKKPTHTSTLSWKSLCGDRLHTIPFVNSGEFKEQKHGKDAETQGFTSSPLLLLPLLPSSPPHAGQAAAQEGWHRNVYSRLCWLEYQWSPAMSLTANRKEEKETLPQKKQIAGDELSQQVPHCNSELVVSESRYRRLL